MKKGLKQGWISVLLFVFMLTALFIPNKNVQADTIKQKAGTVIMDVERFTIGQGFYLEPEQLPFYEGETVKDVLQRFIGEDKMVLKGDYYMEGIKGADLGIDAVKVPDYISKTGIKGPTTEEAKEFGNGNDNDLMEFDYYTYAGWVYFANNTDPVTGINDYKLKDGDVIRMQFTLTLGTDLSGIEFGTGKVLCVISNKDEALKEIGRINSSEYKEELFAKEGVEDKYTHLKESVQDAVISQEVLDKEVEELKAAADPFLASKVTSQIEKLDEDVDLTKADEITKVKEAFDRLMDAQKYVPEASTTKLNNIVEKLQSLQDTEAAEKVINKINELAQVTIDLSKENQVKEARTAYEGLTANQKELVTNLSILENAEQIIKNLKTPKPVEPTPVAPKPSTPTVSPKPTTPAAKPSIKVGTTVKSTTGKEYVKVTSTSKKTVEYVKPAKKTYTNVSIPATVKISGKTYKVTAISANAFKGMTKLKKVTIGKNVGKIGAKAFYKCKNLRQITIASTTLSSGKVAGNAFSGTKKKAVVKVPKSKYNAYKKFLLKKGNKTIRVKK